MGSLDVIHSTGTNPDSEKSVVVYALAKRTSNNHYERSILISQVITKEELTDFLEKELFPIKEIVYTDKEACGGYGAVTVRMKNGGEKTVDFEKIEGKLMLWSSVREGLTVLSVLPYGKMLQ